ncbi:MAG: hypothetical protein SO401_00840 [Blautia sp.]|nr:hypothetical protein [Blautia sp.]
MKDKDFEQMLVDLVRQEEERLRVNSEEFTRRHNELMELIEKASKGGKHNGKDAFWNAEERKRPI